MNELTNRLATGEHPVTLGGPNPSVENLQTRITQVGWLHVKFTDTRGGTDLGIPLDKAACDFSTANFDEGTGSIHIEGDLTLNHDRVRCIADLDLATLNGTGHLVPIAESAATLELADQVSTA